MNRPNAFRYFKISPEIIHLAIVMRVLGTDATGTMAITDHDAHAVLEDANIFGVADVGLGLKL